MTDEQFIKKGIVKDETEDQPVKTASDEVVEKVRACSPNCSCNCKANKKEQ